MVPKNQAKKSIIKYALEQTVTQSNGSLGRKMSSQLGRNNYSLEYHLGKDTGNGAW